MMLEDDGSNYRVYIKADGAQVKLYSDFKTETPSMCKLS